MEKRRCKNSHGASNEAKPMKGKKQNDGKKGANQTVKKAQDYREDKRELGKQKYCKDSKPSRPVDGEVSKTTVFFSFKATVYQNQSSEPQFQKPQKPPTESKQCPTTKITVSPTKSKQCPTTKITVSPTKSKQCPTTKITVSPTKSKQCPTTKITVSPTKSKQCPTTKTTVSPTKSKQCPTTKITGAQNPAESKETPGASPIRGKKVTALIPQRKYACTMPVNNFYQAQRPNFRGGFKDNSNESYDRKKDVPRSPHGEVKQKPVSLSTPLCAGRQQHSHPKAGLSPQYSPGQQCQRLKKKGSFSFKERENESQKECITSEKRHKVISNVTTKGSDVEASTNQLKSTQSASKENSVKSQLELTQDRPNKANQTPNNQSRDNDKYKETAMAIMSTDSGVLDLKSDGCTTAGAKRLPLLGQTISSPMKIFTPMKWLTRPEQELVDEKARVKNEEGKKKEPNACSSSEVQCTPPFQDGSLSNTRHLTVITKDNQKLPFVSVMPSKCQSQRDVPLNLHEEDKMKVAFEISTKDQKDKTIKPEGKDKDTEEFFKIMDSEAEIEEGGSVDDCVICQSCTPNAVIYTCGHLCLCLDCANKVKSTADARCPLCRTTILDIIRVFRP